MKKRIVAVLMACIAVVSITACGTTAPATNTDNAPKAEAPAQQTPTPKEDNQDLESLIAADAEATSAKLQKELDALYEATGDTYDGYKENVDKLTEWYALAESESTALYGRINESTIQYLKTVEATTEKTDFETWSDALDDSYKAWDRGMEDYYKAWDEMYEDLYKKYDRILSDAYDQVSYEEASDAWDDMYDAYSDSWDQMYRDYSDAWDDMYDLNSDIYDAVYDEEVDIDAIVNKTNGSTEAQEAPQKEEAEETKADTGASDEVTPEFKELMDSYEAFVDEYCEFMEEYADSDDITGMMGEYTEYMQKLADYTEKLDAYDEDDMSDADLSYYLEVTNRCNQKLLEVA